MSEQEVEVVARTLWSRRTAPWHGNTLGNDMSWEDITARAGEKPRSWMADLVNYTRETASILSALSSLRGGVEGNSSSSADGAACGLTASTDPDAASLAGKWRKRPVVIDAFRLGEDWPDWWGQMHALNEVTTDNEDGRHRGGPDHALVHTLEGVMRAEKGDWIIRGVEGEIYPCKPDIFAATYEPAGLALQSTPSPLPSPIDQKSGDGVEGWRPIETAPRDGTRLDLWLSTGRRMSDAWWSKPHQTWACDKGSAEPYEIPGLPTHWMLLPSPPLLAKGVTK